MSSLWPIITLSDIWNCPAQFEIRISCSDVRKDSPKILKTSEIQEDVWKVPEICDEVCKKIVTYEMHYLEKQIFVNNSTDKVLFLFVRNWYEKILAKRYLWNHISPFFFVCIMYLQRWPFFRILLIDVVECVSIWPIIHFQIKHSNN